MHNLNEIDSLEIFVLMDNISDPFTKNKDGIYWNESEYRHNIRKQNKLCGADYCRACNGLSLFIRIQVGNKTHTLLFDTGPDKNLIVENAKKLHVNLTEVQAIVLSHGHFDHYGGTLSALQAINKTNLPVYVHPELFLPRAFGEHDLTYVSDNLTKELIEQHGGKVIESAIPNSFFDDTALISGEVSRMTPYELGLPDEHVYKNNDWQCAPDVIDERCLIFKLKNKGICVLTGCGHTGIVNATRHAMKLVNNEKVHLVMGGFHLAESDIANRISPTICDLKTINPDYIVTGHCTGRQAQAEFSRHFLSKHIPYGVGAYFKF